MREIRRILSPGAYGGGDFDSLRESLLQKIVDRRLYKETDLRRFLLQASAPPNNNKNQRSNNNTTMTTHSPP
jgi:hypothetical protein